MNVVKKRGVVFVSRVLFACFAFVAVSCGNETKREERGFFVSPGNGSFGMDLYGRARSGSLYVPPSYTGERPYSLIIALHGAGGTGKSLETLGFNRAADELDFIVAYPDGVGFRWDAPDDTPFVMTLILELSARFSIDPKRIYLTGHSAGAMEAYELAVALPGQFAAVAPVAGLMPTGTSPEGRPPLSVLHIHAKDDPEVPYAGTEEWGLSSVEDSLAYWRAVNERDMSEPTAAERSDWGDGMESVLWRGDVADTAHISLATNGHVWPAFATERVVEFFYNHPPRDGRVAVTCGDGKLVTGEVASLKLRADIDSDRPTAGVEYFSSGKKVAESAIPPFSAIWRDPERGCHRVSARVTPKNGTAYGSTINPTVIVAADAIPPAGFRATSSSAENETLLPGHAIDGNTRTRWASGWTDDESLTVDLGEAKTVSGITLAWESAYAVAYAIETSTDGVSWERSFETTSGKGGFEHIPLDDRSTRAIRFIGVKRGTPWGYSLWELIVHGE